MAESGTRSRATPNRSTRSPRPAGSASVLELTAIEGLGAKTARTLYREHGIDGAAALARALADGRLSKIKGIGPKTLATIERRVGPRSGR